VSSLHHTDRHMHHEDGSHRWSGGPPDRAGHEVWLAELRAHLADHKADLLAEPGERKRTRRAARTLR
jgi:hypothetical protein